MIPRKNDLALLLQEFPAVAILGPRQVGKTTLVRMFAQKQASQVIYLDLELNSDRQKLEDAESYFQTHRNQLIIIDEIQYLPRLFSALRPEIDALRQPGRFLLTGSANPSLVRGASESLAGRIAYLHLDPLQLTEVIDASYNLEKHWFRGGYPTAFLSASDEAFHRWMENYIESFIQRDLRSMFDVNLDTHITRNIWNMLANNNGGILNLEHYAKALGIKGPTVKRYLMLLEGAFLIRVLQPWFANSNKRLVKSPKVYIRDSGMLHHFMNIKTVKELPGNLIIGSSWEGYVIEEICKQLPKYIQAYFYRTHHGAEIDLLLVKNNKPIVAIEIKNSKAPFLSEGIYNCIEDLATQNNYLIYTGTDRYKVKNLISVIGLEEFIRVELPKWF